MKEFSTQEELKQFVQPVLKIRIQSLQHSDWDEEKLFQYLKDKKWKNEKNLHLYTIVNDILNEKIE